jgi:hypothetical protein
VHIEVVLRRSSDGAELPVGRTLVTETNGWRTFSWAVSVPDGDSFDQVVIRGFDGQPRHLGGYVFVDDVRVTCIEAESPPAPSCALDPGLVSAGNTFARHAILAQTFTPPRSGPLVRIQHGLRHGGADSVTRYDLLITTTNQGVPTWRPGQPYEPARGVLLSRTGLGAFASGSQVDGAVPVFAGPSLEAGKTYALVLIPVGEGLMYWRGNSGASSYPNGSAFEWSGSAWVVPGTGPRDFGFRLEGSTCR